MDSVGQAYVTGQTASTAFPMTNGAFQTTLHGSQDAFITKIKANGAALTYSTFLGGAGIEACKGIALFWDGSVWVTGTTASSDYPVTSDAYQKTRNGTNSDLILTNLNASGSALASSTYIGGVASESGGMVATGPGDSVFIFGYTNSTDFPTSSGALRTTNAGVSDLVLAKFAPPITTTLIAGNASGQVGAAVALTATLTAGGAGLADQWVTFAVGGVDAGGSVTDASGAVTRSFNIPSGAAVGTQEIVASYAGDATHVASSGSGTLTVSRRTTSLAVSSLSGEIGATVTLSATLTAGGSGVAGKTVAFTVDGAAAGSGTTNASGVASASYAISAGAVVGTKAIGAAFTADATHAGSAGSGTLTITRRIPVVSVDQTLGEIGATVTLSATLTAGGAGLLGQSLAFTVNGVAAGSGTTSASGVATLSYTIPESAAVGTQLIRVSFAGDATYAAAEGIGPLGISKRTTALTVDAASGELGSTVTLSAILTANRAGLSGKSVAFTVDGTAAGSGTTDATGVAAISYAISGSASAGAHTVRATFTSDATCVGSTNTGSLTVSKHPASLAAADAGGEIGASVALSATLTSGGVGLPGMTVAFTVGGVSVGSATTNSDGLATVDYAIPGNATVGAQAVGASFAGTTTYAAAAGSATLTVSKRTTALAIADLSGRRGRTVSLTATLTAGGSGMAGKSVAITVDGEAAGTGTTDASGVAAVSYAVGPGMALGAHTITASFAGDAGTQGSAGSAALTVQTPAKGTRVYVSPRTVALGAATTLGAELFDSTQSGVKLSGKTIAFQVDGVAAGSAVTTPGAVSGVPALLPFSTAGLGVGPHTILATFAADADYDGSSSTATLTISKVGTYCNTVDVSAARGVPVTLRGTLSRNGGYVVGATLTFKVDGATVGSGTTSAVGVATLSYTSSDTPGAHPLTVEFAGDDTYAPSSSTMTLTVVAGTTRIYVPALSKAYYDTALIGGQLLDATTGAKLSGRALDIQIDGASIGTATTVAGQGTVSYVIPTALTAGAHTITVAFAGDAAYAASSGSAALTVGLATPRLTASSLTVAAGGKAQLVAVLARTGGYASGRTLSFKIDGTAVGTATTNTGGKAMLLYTAALATGAHTITVEFAGDATLKPIAGTGTLTVTP